MTDPLKHYYSVPQPKKNHPFVDPLVADGQLRSESPSVVVFLAVGHLPRLQQFQEFQQELRAVFPETSFAGQLSTGWFLVRNISMGWC